MQEPIELDVDLSPAHSERVPHMLNHLFASEIKFLDFVVS